MIAKAVFLGLLMAVALNVIAYGLLRFSPLGRSHGKAEDLFDRYETILKPYVLDWFGLTAEQWPLFVAQSRYSQIFGNVYEPFTEFKHPAVTGLCCNVDPNGFRLVADQGPWPPQPEFYTIFFFGGSTAMNFGPDWTSIPSLLQKEVQEFSGRKVKVYNFGRGAYFSTQEMILFFDIVAKGYRPDMAIFLDGLNDCYFYDGYPPTGWLYSKALEQHKRTAFLTNATQRFDRPRWEELGIFVNSLPLIRLVDGVLERGDATAQPLADYRMEPVPPNRIADALARYRFNKAAIEGVAANHGIETLFVWQPSPAYKYDVRHHLALHPAGGLCGHERSETGYRLMQDWMTTTPLGDNFLWLADMQEDLAQPLYLDAVHYTAAFSGMIAARIADELRRREVDA